MMPSEIDASTLKAWLSDGAATLPLPAVSQLNSRLLRYFVKRYTLKRGAIAFGKLLPVGIGAVVAVVGSDPKADAERKRTSDQRDNAAKQAEAEKRAANARDGDLFSREREDDTVLSGSKAEMSLPSPPNALTSPSPDSANRVSA